jgi:hypothetical protein
VRGNKPNQLGPFEWANLKHCISFTCLVKSEILCVCIYIYIYVCVCVCVCVCVSVHLNWLLFLSDFCKKWHMSTNGSGSRVVWRCWTYGDADCRLSCLQTLVNPLDCKLYLSCIQLYLRIRIRSPHCNRCLFWHPPTPTHPPPSPHTHTHTQKHTHTPIHTQTRLCVCGCVYIYIMCNVWTESTIKNLVHAAQ